VDETVPLAAIALSYGMRAGAAEPAIKPLDGSGISRAEIHAAVSRLRSAAEIPGAGIAIL